MTYYNPLFEEHLSIIYSLYSFILNKFFFEFKEHILICQIFCKTLQHINHFCRLNLIYKAECVYLSVSLSIYLPIYLSFYLPIYQSAYLCMFVTSEVGRLLAGNSGTGFWQMVEVTGKVRKNMFPRVCETLW